LGILCPRWIFLGILWIRFLDYQPYYIYYYRFAWRGLFWRGFMGQTIAKLFAVAFLIVSAMFPASRALADHATISMVSIHSYRNLVESGDMVVVFHWLWADNVSSTPASSTVSVSISYNGTIVAQIAPYVYSPFANNGYGDEVSAFYFSANSTPHYAGSYTIRIMGLPSYFGTFTPLPVFDYPMQPADFDTSSDQTINQADLKTYILNECDTFHTIYPSVELKSTTDMGTVLSDYGTAYFNSVIPGLQSLCPSLYFVQTLIPTTMVVTPYDSTLRCFDCPDGRHGHDERGNKAR
jgi:hypothetical protein